MNEAKRAAVVKRGADRDHRDLFASRPADIGSVKQTLRPPPPDFGGVAARNESSVLFTVDALRNAGAARVKTPEPELAPPSSAFVSSDDEGIIDLKSLSSAPPKVGARSVAPLFSEPPPAAFAADVGSSSGVASTMPNGFKFGKRAIAGLAAAAVAVVLCSIGLAAAFKGEEPVAHMANAAMVPVAPPAPAPAVVAPAAPVVASAAPTTASSDDDEKVSTPAKGKGKGKGKAGKAGSKAQSGGVASAKSKTSSSNDPLVSKPTPKAADKCGCKGDFTCILRCTAKGS